MELSTEEAGKALGLSAQTIRDHIAADRLRARKHGFRGLLKIQVDDLHAFANDFNYVIDADFLATLTLAKQISH